MSTPRLSSDDLKNQVDTLKKLIYTHRKVVDLLMVPIVRDAIENSEKGYEAIKQAEKPPSATELERAARMLAGFEAGKRFLERYKDQLDQLEAFQVERLETYRLPEGVDASQHVRNLQSAAIDWCQEFGTQLFKMLEEVDPEKALFLKSTDVVAKAYFKGDFKSEKGFMGFMDAWHMPAEKHLHDLLRAHRRLVKDRLMDVAEAKVVTIKKNTTALMKNLPADNQQGSALWKEFLSRHERWKNVVNMLNFHETELQDFERGKLANRLRSPGVRSKSGCRRWRSNCYSSAVFCSAL
ncbi:Nn.00g080500.m01.CDS01 [Neocucurbitaria sp. VM-36]